MADVMRRERFLEECQRRFGFNDKDDLSAVLAWMIWADTFIDEARNLMGEDVYDLAHDTAIVAEEEYKKAPSG